VRGHSLSFEGFGAMIRQLLCCALILGLAGCGGSRSSVSGTVTLDGKPLSGASVTFAPVDTGEEAGVSSYGKTDDQGQFTLKTVDNDTPGAVPGKHWVRVSLSVGDPEDDAGTMTVDKVPPWYNTFTLLVKEVDSGDNTINLELSSNLTPEMRQELLSKYQGDFGQPVEKWLRLKSSGKLD
jgi:hypothetical protein